MSEREQPHEPEAPENPGISAFPGKGRQSFARLRRALTDEELSSTAVQRMLIDEIERLEADCIEHRAYVKMYHDESKKRAVAEEKLLTKRAVEVLHVSSLSAGSLALGFAPTIWTTQPAAWLMVIGGGTLIVGSIVAKIIKT